MRTKAIGGKKDAKNTATRIPIRYGSQGRRDHTHVKIFQRFHIADDARQQVAAFVVDQTGRSEGFEFFIEPYTQSSKQTERDIVRDEPLKIPEESAADTKEPHTDHRDAKIRHRGMQGCRGDQPRRGTN